MKQQRLWLWVAAMCALIPACLAHIPSADLWWLLAQGRWICEHHLLPTQDVFSFSAAGQTWHNDQWLSALIFYGLDQAGGLLALHIFKAVMLCATFVILLDTGMKLAGPERVTVALLPVLGLGCMWASQEQYFFDVRAYLFTYLITALWWRWLLLKERISAPALVGSAWLWANLHAGVLIGLAILILAWLSGHPQLRPRVILAACLVTLINPSGWDLHLHVVRLLGSPWGLYLNEWIPIWRDWRQFGIYPAYLLLSLIVLVPICGRWQAVCLLAVGALSLSGWRHIVLFCWLSIPLWCLASSRLKRWDAPWLQPLLLALLLGRAVYSLPGQTPERLSMVNALFPRWAADFLSANPLGPRLYNPYGCGGYLMWRLYPQYQVCIDGRAAQVYPVEAYIDYLRASRSRDALVKYLDTYQVDTALLSCVFPEANRALLDGDQNWTPIYEDDSFCLFQRSTTLKASYQPIVSPRTLFQQAQADPKQALALLDQAIQLDPDYPQAYFLRGTLALIRHDSEQGLRDINRSLELCPTLPNAHRNLAGYYKDRDPARALRELELEQKNSPARE